MRIKVGIAANDVNLVGDHSPFGAFVIIRVGRELIFVSHAWLAGSRLIGTIRTDWITVNPPGSYAFSELRGRTVTVGFRGSCLPGARSPIQVKLRVSGSRGTTSVTQQAHAQGDFQGTLEARANHFIRTVPGFTNFPVVRHVSEDVEGVRRILESTYRMMTSF